MRRRTVIELLTGALAGALSQSPGRFVAPAGVPPGLAARPRIGRVGVQLYTVRELMRQDFDNTLREVARIGFREVEFAGYFGRTPPQVVMALDRAGLTAPGSHIGLDDLEGDWPRVVADARTMGIRFLIVAWTPRERRRTLDDWRRIGALFTRAGEVAEREGVTFAYHNHDFEFAPLEGQVPFDVLLESSDPRYVKIEMDLFWIRKGGRDPLDYFSRWPGRFPCVHVKDMAADGRMVDVGAGVIDWRSLLSRRDAGIQHYFVEHDEPGDPLASIRAGYEYLKRLELDG